ncbi:zinc finger protein pita-like [Culicoides brevitarsis]|uniref:zinc finger protein pita-like n=1 Tax=Culicoides brevitarsis TaxID=469753 RepID=UPI00307CB061
MANIAEKKMCRFCFEPDAKKLEDIFLQIPGKTPLAVQVMSCVSIEIFEGDEMPRFCCNICRKLMEVMHQYKQICRKSDILLKQSQITGNLTGNVFELPLKLLRECLPDEKKASKVTSDQSTMTEIPKKVDKATETMKKSQVTKETQTIEKKIVSKSEDLKKISIEKAPKSSQTTIKTHFLKKTPTAETKIVKKVEPKVEKVQPVTLVIENVVEGSPIEVQTSEEQIEILELTQDESEKLVEQPFLLNKCYEQTTSKPVIEFKKFVMTDNGNFEVEILEGIEGSNEKAIFSCDFCSKTYMIKQQLELHLETHFKERKFTCEKCQNKYLSKNDLVKHLQTHASERQHVCVVCDRSFARSGILKRHLLQHEEHLTFVCKKCPEKFVTDADLQKHVEFVHNKPRPFPCKLCDKSFAFKQGLERHMPVHDPSQKPHVCEICNESFHTASKLQQHLPKHTGKRRYACKYCPKTFILSHHLSRHVRSAHKSLGNTSVPKKIYNCTECSDVFTDHEAFIAHSAEHTTQNLICPLCKLKFDKMEDVDLHIEEHALASTHYSCNTCSCAFLSEELLEKHFKENHSLTEENVYIVETKAEDDDEPKVKKAKIDDESCFKVPKGVTIKKKSK